jgi:hypothetical protein
MMRSMKGCKTRIAGALKKLLKDGRAELTRLSPPVTLGADGIDQAALSYLPTIEGVVALDNNRMQGDASNEREEDECKDRSISS